MMSKHTEDVSKLRLPSWDVSFGREDCDDETLFALGPDGQTLIVAQRHSTQVNALSVRHNLETLTKLD